MANVAGMSWRGLHGSAQRSEAGGTWALVRGDRLGLPADHTVALQHVLHAADFRPGEPRRAEQGSPGQMMCPQTATYPWPNQDG
jgi:hypothetical protein